MSIQSLFKNPANANLCPNNYDLKCNSLDVCDNINVPKINGLPLPAITGGLSNQFLKTTLPGVVQWEYFQLGSMSQSLGPADSVLITNNTATSAAWSKDLILDNLTVTNQFISATDTNLDNVNIISSLDIAGISPSAGQVVGTDNMNILGWQSLPLQQKYSIYHCTASLNINFGVNTTLTYVPGYNDLVGSIDQTAPSNFTCNTPGTYYIKADISCLASTSENECQIFVSSLGPVAYSFINLASSYASMSAVVNLQVGDIIQILSVRTNLDATPKLNLANGLSSPIIFSRIL